VIQSSEWRCGLYTGKVTNIAIQSGYCYNVITAIISIVSILIVSKISVIFTPDSIYAIARICHRNSISPSVRLSHSGSVKNG